MKAHIFAEDSKTTADDTDQPALTYYQGLFGMIAGLYGEIKEHAETELHILSEDYGLINGSDYLPAIESDTTTPVGIERLYDETKLALRNAASDSNVIVILLSASSFESTVTQVWTELVENAIPGSIWCVGAARTALDNLDIEALEAKGCTVITYRRVGVARIGTETRSELLEVISNYQ